MFSKVHGSFRMQGKNNNNINIQTLMKKEKIDNIFMYVLDAMSLAGIIWIFIIIKEGLGL